MGSCTHFGQRNQYTIFVDIQANRCGQWNEDMANLSSLEKTRQLNIDPVVLLALGFLIYISCIFDF